MCVLRHIYSKLAEEKRSNKEGSHSSPISALDMPLLLQDLKTLRISRQSANEGGMVVSPKRRPPLSSGNIPCTYSC